MAQSLEPQDDTALSGTPPPANPNPTQEGGLMENAETDADDSQPASRAGDRHSAD